MIWRLFANTRNRAVSSRRRSTQHGGGEHVRAGKLEIASVDPQLGGLRRRADVRLQQALVRRLLCSGKSFQLRLKPGL